MITLSANSHSELVQSVRKYWNDYHPAGYGTRFYLVDPENGKRNICLDEDIWGDDPLRKASPDENGVYTINVSRASHCD